MLVEIGYDRSRAVEYALNWAFKKNELFYDFENIGGDCTNFVSQCLYAGCGVMNYSSENGWYYIDINNRAPSWTGVVFLKEFLLTNQGPAVYGASAPLESMLPGDVIQLRNREGVLYHSMIVSYVRKPVIPENIYICAHSYDARDRKLSTYNYFAAEGIHILGARNELRDEEETNLMLMD